MISSKKINEFAREIKDLARIGESPQISIVKPKKCRNIFDNNG